jgi:hypothetical protein
MATTTYRTARKAHLCDSCHWVPSLRGVPTILAGHRYLEHKTFPGDEGFEEGARPVVNRECIACAVERDYGSDLMAGACGSFCCGDKPCARPVGHDLNHACSRDAEYVSRDLTSGGAR